MYLISQSAKNGQPGKWSIIQVAKNVSGLEFNQIFTTKLYESYYNKLILLINEKFIRIKSVLTLEESSAEIKVKESVNNIFAQQQKSFALFDFKLLKPLFYKGYIKLVLKILVKLQRAILISEQDQQKLTDFLDFDIEELHQNILEHVKEMNDESSTQKEVKVETASALFGGDPFGFFEDEKKKEEPKKGEAKIDEQSQELEREFEDNFKKYMEALKSESIQEMLGFKSDQVTELVIFSKKFRCLYKKNFFAGNCADILLRQTFYETEEIQLDIDPEKEMLQQQQQLAPMNLIQMLDNIRSEAQMMSKGNSFYLENWTSFKCELAMISKDSQDVIINSLTDRFDFDNNFNWEMMKKLCMSVWVEDINKLKMLTEKVAKGEYKIAGDDFGKSSRAEKTALWYVLLGKKQALCQLYKIEPQCKKIYELLLNDFSQQKFQTTAKKNAIALMSRQNYIFACAFFILGNDIDSALQVAISRLNDPILAILMLRLVEGEESQKLYKIYQEHFVQRGEQVGDPYLKSIGYWRQKQYIQAINAFKIEVGGGSNLTNLLKSDVTTFNIGHVVEFEQKKKVISIADAQASAQGDLKLKEVVKTVLPINVQYDYYVLDLIRQMKKLPVVKNRLNFKSDTGMDRAKGGDFFDDFFAGGGGDNKAKEEEEKKKQDENKLQVDESKILQLVSFDASQSGLPLVSLIIMSENIEFIERVEDSYKEKIAKTILNDLSRSFTQHVDFQQLVKKANSSIRVLASNFEIDEMPAKQFIMKQCNQMGLIGLEILFYLEMQRDDVVYRLEDYAMKLLDFIYCIGDFPYVILISNFDQPIKNKHTFKYLAVQKVLTTLSNLEQIIECLLGLAYSESYDTDEHSNIKTVNPSVSANRVVGMNKQQTKIGQKSNMVALSHAKTTRMFGVYEEEEFASKHSDERSRISFKEIRTILIMYLALIQVCFVTRQIKYIPSLLSTLRNILNQQASNFTGGDINGNFDKLIDVNYQKLKIKIQKIKHTITQKIKPEVEEKKEEEQEDQGVQMKSQFVNAENQQNEERKKEAQQQEQKILEFYYMWFRYITSYNTSFVLKSAYQESIIKNLINVRPLIIQNRKIQEVIIPIINQRLNSHDLLKKMENQYRILENVTSYYFEKFLQMKDRKVIIDQMLSLKESDFKKSVPSLIQQLFEKDHKFIKFAMFMDVKTFIQYLKEHDLSLIYHSSNEGSNSFQVERTKELFQTGVDLFRLKGETVQSFAFDRTGKDHVVLALQNKGIREIPIYKTLLCRNRMNNGLTLVDEEQTNWSDCLHRYDKYPIPNSNNDPIIAVIDKIYREKTIHFIRTDKRKKTTSLVDREVSPPEYWSGIKSSEYLKVLLLLMNTILQCRSNLEVSHEDYSYAVESHPFLPLYMTGNAKGLLNLWAFEQEQDKALDQWITQLDQKNAIPKKATIKKICFSGYGDKVASCNMEGSFFIFNFDTFDSSKMIPIYNIKKTKELKFNDFEYLNADTVVAMASLKPKKLWVYDTLIPQRSGLVIENGMGGNLLLANKVRHQIYTCNERPGQVNIFDMRYNKILQSVQLHNDEITAITINEQNNTVVAGFKDGMVKIINVGKGEFETRESTVMFSSSGNKKGSVTQVRVNPNNGALYASSLNGNFKLLRTKV